MAATKKSLLVIWISILLLVACSTTRSVSSFQPQLIKITGSATADSAITALIMPYQMQIADKMSRVIGETAHEMTKQKVESVLGNFVADLFLQECAESFNLSADASLLTIGGLRAPLPKGKITVGDIFELCPFDNEMVVLTLTGKQLRQTLDILATEQKAAVGNIRFIIYNQQATQITVNQFPLDEQKNYNVLTYDYLANGGDKLAPLTAAAKRQEIGIKVRDLVIKHFEKLHQQGKKASAQLDGRVRLGP